MTNLQTLVVKALRGLGSASRERVGVRMRLQGLDPGQAQLSEVLKKLSRKTLARGAVVRKVPGAVKGPNVRWELVDPAAP